MLRAIALLKNSRTRCARLCSLLMLAALSFAAGTLRLYMKDGEYHVISDYKIEGERVKYFSTERGDWEEIPLAMVDLKRTEGERKSRSDAEKTETTLTDAEDKAEREARREIARVPAEAGAYWISGSELKPLAIAEAKFVVNKKRQILKVMSPIPMVTGKATYELDGAASKFIVGEDRPEFYFRLSKEERLAIFRLTPDAKKGVRVVQKMTIAPVVNEIVEEPIVIETFRREVGELLFKIWPTEKLAPGEYALVQFTPAQEGNLNIQVWDFSLRR